MMNDPTESPGEVRGEVKIVRRARVAEIAKRAGVGTATVDRVLNERPHVSPATRQRVLQAKAAIETGARIAARPRLWRLKVFLPHDAGSSTEYLGTCLQAVGAEGNATVECVYTKKMEPAVLARKLRACVGQRIDAIAFQALEDPRVRDAVEYLAARGNPERHAPVRARQLRAGRLRGHRQPRRREDGRVPARADGPAAGVGSRPSGAGSSTEPTRIARWVSAHRSGATSPT